MKFSLKIPKYFINVTQILFRNCQTKSTVLSMLSINFLGQISLMMKKKTQQKIINAKQFNFMRNEKFKCHILKCFYSLLWYTINSTTHIT